MGSGILCSVEETAKPCKPLRAQLLESILLHSPVSSNNRISYSANLEASVILEFDFASKSIRALVISVEPQT